MNQTATKSRTTFSPWQLMVISIIAGMGGMYFYPRDFSRSSFILLIVAVVMMLLSTAMLTYSFKHSESVSFPNLLRENLGSFLSRIILAAAAVYFADEICCIAVKQTQMTGLFLLEKTPPQIILAVMLITGSFIIYSGIRQISRTAELLFFVIMLPLTFILILALCNLDYGELIPLFKPGKISASQITNSILPFSGIAAIAYFAGYYDKSKITKSLVCGVSVLSIYSVIILMSCVGVFSVDGTKHLSFPLAELSRIVSFGNISVTERYDILYMIIYTAAAILTVGILTYCCCISLCGLFGVKSHKCFIFILLPIIFILSYYGLSNSKAMEQISVWGKIIFLFILIPVLFITSAIKNLRRKTS